ncbi:MAG: K+/H+ antiporter subunit F [Campylobacterales bacterium]
MSNLIIPVVFIMLSIAMMLNLYRLVVGPSKTDRILALDTLYINSIGILIIVSLHYGSAMYFEAALLIAVMGFVGTVGFSKYLLRGDIIE